MGYKQWTKITSWKLHVNDGRYLIEVEEDEKTRGDDEHVALLTITSMENYAKIVENRQFEDADTAQIWALGWAEGESYRYHWEEARRLKEEEERCLDAEEEEGIRRDEERRRRGYED